MQELQDIKVEAAGSVAAGSPANTQLSGVKMHGTACKPLEKLVALWSNSWKSDKQGRKG